MLSEIRTYPVKASARRPHVNFMTRALEGAGCTILAASPLSSAPFLLTLERPGGERIGLVVYAFTATRTPTANRPADERSFQIKYGNKADFGDDNSHELWLDPHRLYTTLLLGIDSDERFFVGLDPRQHNPTKFFIRVEFKDEQAAAIQRLGWHSWHRQRRPTGHDQENVEVLVGGTAETFLSYVLFERAAEGLLPQERLHLSREWQR